MKSFRQIKKQAQEDFEEKVRKLARSAYTIFAEHIGEILHKSRLTDSQIKDVISYIRMNDLDIEIDEDEIFDYIYKMIEDNFKNNL